MNWQNKTTKNKIAILNAILLCGLLVSIVFNLIKINTMHNIDMIIFLICLVLILFLNYLGAPYFKYDSKGETLIVSNEKSFPFSLVKENKIDFPKDMLTKYSIERHLLFKKKLVLFITCKSLQNKNTKMNFYISYLSKKALRNLDISLGKIIKENNKNAIFGSKTELKKSESLPN